MTSLPFIFSSQTPPDESYGGHYGGGGYGKGAEMSHLHGGSFGGGHGGYGGGHGGAYGGHHQEASYSAHPIVNTYEGKIGNEYGGGSAVAHHHSGGYGGAEASGGY